MSRWVLAFFFVLDMWMERRERRVKMGNDVDVNDGQ